MLRASIAKELLFRASDMAHTESPRSAIIFGVVLLLSCSLSQSRSHLSLPSYFFGYKHYIKVHTIRFPWRGLYQLHIFIAAAERRWR